MTEFDCPICKHRCHMDCNGVAWLDADALDLLPGNPATEIVPFVCKSGHTIYVRQIDLEGGDE